MTHDGGPSDIMLTGREAARYAGVSRKTIRVWLHVGLLHPRSSHGVGGRGQRVIRLSELGRVLRDLSELSELEPLVRVQQEGPASRSS